MADDDSTTNFSKAEAIENKTKFKDPVDESNRKGNAMIPETTPEKNAIKGVATDVKENDGYTTETGSGSEDDGMSENKAIVKHLHDRNTFCDFSSKDDIAEIFDDLDSSGDSSGQFQLIPDDVCLDPHDEENNFLYNCFRAKDGSRLNKEIVQKEFLLVGYDKCGLSGVLNIPVPSGATLSVRLSTWLNPCHGEFKVGKTYCFGIGMVPFGKGKEESWIRGDFKTSIENGVQYYAQLAFERMIFAGGSGGGFGMGFGMGGMSALLAGGDPLEYSFHAMQEGSILRHSKYSKMTLDHIDVRIKRDEAGTSEFSFVHGDESIKIIRPADEENSDMQLYFNSLGWPDNNQYVQIHQVVYEPPISEAGHEKKNRKKPSAEKDYPDYNKILKKDPDLRKKVDALIDSKKN